MLRVKEVWPKWLDYKMGELKQTLINLIIIINNNNKYKKYNK
jgi:hypothetical protein